MLKIVHSLHVEKDITLKALGIQDHHRIPAHNNGKRDKEYERKVVDNRKIIITNHKYLPQ